MKTDTLEGRAGKTSVQVVVGTKVQFVADAFSKLCE